jgi:hypothetical protein
LTLASLPGYVGGDLHSHYFNRRCLTHRLSISILLLACSASALHAQQDSTAPRRSVARDFAEASPAEAAPIISSTTESSSTKSLWLAGGLSALLPGAGQVYADAPWWRTALYAGLEAAGWAAYAIYNAKGNRATDDFQNYADTHWSVLRYVNWIAANYQRWPDESVDKQAAAEALRSIYVQGSPQGGDWEKIDFAQLNKLEHAVKAGFSHTLPPHGDQQYYEEVGKYVQYRSGWDDHAVAGDTVIYNPSRVTQGNLDYMSMRAEANHLLSIATTAIGGLALNHLASVIDAVLQARHVNLSLRAELHGELLPDGRIAPAAGLAFTFRF